jgi:hypothetical protein
MNPARGLRGRMEHAAGSRIEGATLIAVLVPDLRLTRTCSVFLHARASYFNNKRGAALAEERPSAAPWGTRPRKQKRGAIMSRSRRIEAVGDRILGVVPEVAPDFNLFECRNARRATDGTRPNRNNADPLVLS